MTRKRKHPYNKRDLIAALRKLSDFWPDGYGIFVGSGTLCLMKLDADGEFIENEGDDGIGQDCIVDTFLGITADLSLIHI